ncbi:MAG: ankyrin repeat domain-containing protein [Mailhella sp.]|nr:ankyrin repeat domain-containing protein [Mailhella sp.]
MRLSHILMVTMTILSISGCMPKQEQPPVIATPPNVEDVAHSPQELMEEAIFKHSLETFEKLFAENPDVDKNRLLTRAIAMGRPDIMKILLDAGADPNYHPAEGNPEFNLLFIPSFIRRIEVPKLLIESGTDIHFRTSTGLTALHAAAEMKDVEKAELLIRHGINVDARSLKGNTPLHIATGKTSTLDYHIETYGGKGIMLSPEEKEELEQYLKSEQLEMVSMLLAKGANPNAANKGKVTPLHSAASYGRAQVVKKLIAHNANVNLLDGQGWSPLEWAIASDNFETVQVLLSNGVSIKKTTTPYSSPLHGAVAKGNLKISKALIACGADVNHPITVAEDESNFTPIHLAATNNFPEIVDLLIQKGADVTVKTSKGLTVLDIINERPERIEKFKKSGVFWKINDALYNAM